ncbi:hypothetical protein [Acinetobacter radioresistens]|uniref:hypothetical protein n=1 Tax=Acinetobacter radioresistens TaxID=40216 RepID=UPI000C3373A4|nr:hypothetical protein [Acinetobacter radioresistens]PKH28751.1 hypothetical protein BJF94_12410 [Acinetobacter radioresistens]
MTKHDNVSQEGIMKATEFVKEHGIEKARECIEDANDYGGFWVNAKTLELSNLIPSYDAVSIPSIQRLVESHELVERAGGLRECRFMSYRMNVGDRLAQAIADVEACQ